LEGCLHGRDDLTVLITPIAKPLMPTEHAMASQAERSDPTLEAQPTPRGRRVRGVLLLVMGCLAIASPFFAGGLALFLVGLLLMACGVLEMLETFHVADEVRRRTAYLGGVLSVLGGILLLAQPQLVIRGLSLFLAGSFLLDGASKVAAAWKTRATDAAWRRTLAGGLINCVLAIVLATRWPISGEAVVAFLVAIRMLTAGWSMLLGRADRSVAVAERRSVSEYPDIRLGIPAHEEFGKLQSALKEEEAARRRIDAAWCWALVIVFFAIHVGRMHMEWNLVGMLSPLVAVLGDVGTALLLSFGIVLPCQLAWRKLTRPIERRAWRRALARMDSGQQLGVGGRIKGRWLLRRLRFSWRMVRMRYSPRAALRWGLQVGLPLTAILIAVNPIWGFSWFFNSESWATGIWDRWAAARTDTWREEMIRAVENHYANTNIPHEHLFQVTPEGVAGKDDFSFLVLGDTGEGGTAQHSLRDRFLFLGRRPDVKFLVISSDVIYPSGALADYEAKFYLPFKGFTKPIYAIPGNHDWYDALEGFSANFLEADAARVSMHARVVTDNRLTTTTDGRIDEMIREGERLRHEYGVSTGWQRGPFFEVQTDRFALIAVDTGVLRQVDNAQWAWLQAALGRSQAKFTMVILGHPLYAGGRYQGGNDELMAGEWTAGDAPPEVLGLGLPIKPSPFAAIHRLLRDNQVPVVMAGDTHYLECYREQYKVAGAMRTMHHFVNGGGGAYMSIGTPLDWPREPAVADCAFYPRTDVVIDKLDRETPAWKTPLWLWVKHLRGWPLTAEAMAGAFLYSRAPYLQSFMEIQVANSKGEVRLIPHGVNGPLRWREMQTFGAMRPAGKTDEDAVEFVIPMARGGP
jgi:uncharacterized membrane protein HdeD (DUF308 family)